MLLSWSVRVGFRRPKDGNRQNEPTATDRLDRPVFFPLVTTGVVLRLVVLAKWGIALLFLFLLRCCEAVSSLLFRSHKTAALVQVPNYKLPVCRNEGTPLR
jgi:hypothetical protein